MVEENGHCLLATIGKGSKIQHMLNLFGLLLPQMIHYMTQNKEPGTEWSQKPFHVHASMAPSPAQDAGDVNVQSNDQPVRDYSIKRASNTGKHLRDFR